MSLHWNRPIPGSATSRRRPYPGLTSSTAGDTTWATTEPGEPGWQLDFWTCTVWYRWTAQASGQVIFDSVGSTATSRSPSHRRTLADLREIAANADDNYLGSLTACVVFWRQRCTTIESAADPDLSSGPVTLNWHDLAANERLVCLGARGHRPFRFRQRLDARRDTRAGELGHVEPAVESGRTIWYRWTAPATGDVRFHTDGSAIRTVLAAYTGSSLSTLVKVASDYDQGNGTAIWICGRQGSDVFGRGRRLHLDGGRREAQLDVDAAGQ